MYFLFIKNIQFYFLFQIVIVFPNVILVVVFYLINHDVNNKKKLLLKKIT